jgi:hypothetical protein
MEKTSLNLEIIRIVSAIDVMAQNWVHQVRATIEIL